MTAGFGFARAARLRRSADYRRVQDRGRALREAHVVVLVLAGGEADATRFGITVSRKVGGAVARNRVKRWLREAIRHERDRVANGWDVVIVARPSAARAGAASLQEEVAHALAGLGSEVRSDIRDSSPRRGD